MKHDKERQRRRNKREIPRTLTRERLKALEEDITKLFMSSS